MNRRQFIGTAALAQVTGHAADTKESNEPPHMKLGTQHAPTDDALRTFAALGITHMCSDLPSRTLDEKWSIEGLTRLREHVDSFGIKLVMVPLPMSSSYITKAEMPDIMLGRSPERDRQIDQVCQMIRNAAAAGIPALKYNMTILGVVRNEPTPGRGGSRISTFDYATLKQEPPLTEAGKVTAEMMWDRITYFLKRVIPVANEYKIRMACHPHDPGMPRPQGFRGVDRVLGSVAGLERFLSIEESPYHGLNFCQGTVSEMLEDPRREIVDVIHRFGSRKKIFNVHFRNIHGHFLKFQETFPDDGDVDMIEAIRAYKSVGYDGMLMPDHVPKIEGDTGGRQAFAFAFGYIRALIQSVYHA